MSKLIYYVAASMDGYIATQDHELDWLTNFIRAAMAVARIRAYGLGEQTDLFVVADHFG
ncbi:hypothetical protein DFO62_104389 [Serratia fonticola]|nr:hypothetical protein DFO62_104389 [Serratia fonticola]